MPDVIDQEILNLCIIIAKKIYRLESYGRILGPDRLTSINEIINEGYVNAKYAFKRFDRNSGKRPLTFLRKRINGAIIEYLVGNKKKGLVGKEKINMNIKFFDKEIEFIQDPTVPVDKIKIFDLLDFIKDFLLERDDFFTDKEKKYIKKYYFGDSKVTLEDIGNEEIPPITPQAVRRSLERGIKRIQNFFSSKNPYWYFHDPF